VRCRLLILVLFLLLSGYVQSGHAQEHTFYNLAAEDGLTSTFVIDVTQDTKGLMWFSTQGGAVRYDGNKIRVFSSIPGDSTALPYDYIRSVMHARSGYTWMATFGGGLARFDPVTEKFRTYVNPFSTSANRIHKLIEDPSGKIWLATEGSGLHRFDPATGTFRFFDPDPQNKEALLCRQLRHMAMDEEGTLWVATRFSGLYAFDPGRNKWTHYSASNKGNRRIMTDTLINVYANHKGKVYISGSEGVSVIDIRTGLITFYDPGKMSGGRLKDYNTTAALEDSRKRLWIGTNKGLLVYDLLTGSTAVYQADPLVEGSLSDNRVLSLFESGDGTVWVGTWSGGVNVTDADGQRFNRLFHHPLDNNSLPGNNILGLAGDDLGNVWIGTLNDGLCKYDPRANKFTRFYEQAGGTEGITSNKVWDIYKDNSGNIWVGCNTGGLHKVDPDKNTVRKIRAEIAPGKPLSGISISAIYRDRKGFLWLGTFSDRALLRYDENSNSITRYPIYQAKDSSAASTAQLYDIVSSPEGLLWLSTNGSGLIRFNPEDGTYKIYKVEAGHPYGLTSNKIGMLYCDREGYLWLLTVGGGLQCMDTRYPGRFATLTTRDGLSDNTPMAMAEDEQGYFWISGQGITRFKRPAVRTVRIRGEYTPVISSLEEVRQFSQEPGVKGNIFNLAVAVLNGANRQIYFGGEKGVTFFTPEQIRLQKNLSRVNITGIQLFGKPYTPDSSVLYKQTLVLPYDRNFITFELASTDYAVKGHQNFRYRLAGLDKEWVSSKGRNEAVYTGLQPGNYTFSVCSINLDGTWSEPAVISLTITPPFWQTWWFYTIVTVFIVVVMVFIWKQRIERIRMEEQKKAAFEREKVELELKALRAQMNPHFLFNALTSIEKYILDSQVDKAASFLTGFAKLVRAILENSREEKISLEKELETLERYIQLEQERFRDSFQYSITVADTVDRFDTEIPPMLIQPIVENAIIHGLADRRNGEGWLGINVFRVNQQLICVTVEDNGSGRKDEYGREKGEHKMNRSLGMSITRDRLSKINAGLEIREPIVVTDLKDEQGSAAGTRVEILIFSEV